MSEGMYDPELLRHIVYAPHIGLAIYKAVRNDDAQVVDFICEFINRKTPDASDRDFTGLLLSAHDAAGIRQTALFKPVIECGEVDEYTSHVTSGAVDGWYRYCNAPIPGDRILHTWQDVTAQKIEETGRISLKEELAQKTRDKYHSVISSIDEGFCIYELIYDGHGNPVDLKWVDVNPAYEKHTGLKDTVGKLHSDVSPGTESYWLEIYDKVAKTGEAVHFEEWHEPTGRWYNTFSSRIGGPGSRQVAVLFSDITEQKQLEQRKEFLLKLSDALRSTTDPVAIEEAVTRIAMDHFAADRCYYATLEEDGSATILREALRGDLPSVTGTYPLARFYTYKKLVDAGQVFAVHDVSTSDMVDEELRQQLIGMQQISLLNHPVVRNGRVAGILSIVQSVPRVWTRAEMELTLEVAERAWAAVERARAEDARRESEEHNRAMISQTSVGILRADLTGTITFLNEKARSLFGFEGYEGIGVNVLELTVPEFRDATIHKFQRLIQEGRSFESEKRMTRKDGREFWANVSVSGIKSGGNAVKSIVAVVVDITARKETEEALRKNEEKYRTLFETMEEGFAIMEMVRDGQGQVVDLVYREVNRAFGRHTGLSNVIGRTSRETIPTYDPKRFKFYRRLADTGKHRRQKFM